MLSKFTTNPSERSKLIFICLVFILVVLLFKNTTCNPPTTSRIVKNGDLTRNDMISNFNRKEIDDLASLVETLSKRNEVLSLQYCDITKKTVLPTGGWCIPEERRNNTYFLDEKVLSFFLSIVEPESTILEIGAGAGRYTKHLIESEKFKKITAVDGAAGIGLISNGLVKNMDMSLWQPFRILPKHDWTMCLEVGEHVPKEFEDVILDNIAYHSNHGVFLSWAVPNQGGRGHVNERPNSYIIKKMSERGFSFDEQLSLRLRKTAKLSWFRKTLMIFFRGK